MPQPQSTPLTEDLAVSFLPRRDAADHKWSVGGVVIVAGSPDYPGAAILASRSAGRAGAGIVILATSRSVTGIVAAAIPEVAHIPFGETESHSGAHRAVESIVTGAEKAKAFVIGPGLGQDDSTDGLLSALFGFGGKSETARPRMGFGIGAPAPATSTQGAQPGVFADGERIVVIDADGLNWLAKHPEWWKHLPAGRAILTPHPGEMARLLDKPVADVIADPAKVATDAATTWKQVVLLKGEQAVITDGTTTYVTEAARPSLATAGSGDVLAGMTGALAAQLGKPLEAAALAAFVGPKAAEAVEREYGVAGLISPDLPNAIARELAALAS